MKSCNQRRSVERNGWLLLVSVTLAVAASAVAPTIAQRSGEHWVGTWATADVGRPQTAPALPPAPAPAAQPGTAPAPPPAPPAPFVHFSNQTLRQIVHISVGGD